MAVNSASKPTSISLAAFDNMILVLGHIKRYLDDLNEF